MLNAEIPVLKIPRADAEESELIAHFRVTAAWFSTVSYDKAIDLCFTCLKDGENVTGKASSPSGRNRFCSDECEAVFDRRWKLYQERHGLLTTASKQTTDSPSAKRRQVARRVTQQVVAPNAVNYLFEHDMKLPDTAAYAGHEQKALGTKRAAPKCSRCGEHPRSASHRTGECHA